MGKNKKYHVRCMSESIYQASKGDRYNVITRDDADNQVIRNIKKVELTKEYIEKMKNEAIKHKEEYINSGLIEK